MVNENQRCEIRIYDPDFNWIGATNSAESVQFWRELYDTGQFEIHIQPDKSGAKELAQRGNIIVIGGDGKKSGIVRDISLKEGHNGSELAIYGDTGKGLAKQRLVVPPTKQQDAAALGYDKVSGSAETIIKHYIKRHMTEPSDINRKFKALFLQPDSMRGKDFSWRARFRGLHEEISDISKFAELGWEIYADIYNKRWVCDIIEGTDRTKNQSENSPVIFQMRYHNVNNYTYSEQYLNFKNTGYAGGQGADENRLIYAIGAENSDIDRWEVFLDCANAVDINELIYYGEQKMLAYTESKSIELDALPKVFLYGKDYFLGDKVTVSSDRLNIEVDVSVTSVKEIWERRSGYTCEIRFGEKILNALTVLNQRREIY